MVLDKWKLKYEEIPQSVYTPDMWKSLTSSMETLIKHVRTAVRRFKEL